MQPDFPVFFVLFGLVALGLVVLGLVLAAKHRRELQEFADRHGFTFSPSGAVPLPSQGFFGLFRPQLFTQFPPFWPLGNMGNKSMCNAIWGRQGDIDHYFFDFAVRSADGKSQENFKIAVARTPMEFPETSIRPEGFLDKMGNVLGLKDLQFESEDFNRKFCVRSSDRKFAYDLVHPQCMEFLLDRTPRNWQMNSAYIAVVKNGTISAEYLEGVLADMDGFLELIPAYVREDRKVGAHWQGPMDF